MRDRTRWHAAPGEVPQRMRVATMERVAVERCPAHGVWFDPGELERVLSPRVSAQSFADDQYLRQGIADSFELGSGGNRKIRRGGARSL